MSRELQVGSDNYKVLAGLGFRFPVPGHARILMLTDTFPSPFQVSFSPFLLLSFEQPQTGPRAMGNDRTMIGRPGATNRTSCNGRRGRILEKHFSSGQRLGQFVRIAPGLTEISQNLSGRGYPAYFSPGRAVSRLTLMQMSSEIEEKGPRHKNNTGKQ
jgi:hypothetical protein